MPVQCHHVSLATLHLDEALPGEYLLPLLSPPFPDIFFIGLQYMPIMIICKPLMLYRRMLMVGERIKIARKGARMSLRDLASSVGVSPMAISKYERDMDMPSSEILIRLAKSLGVTLDYLLRPTSISISQPVFRCRISRFKVKERDAIGAKIQDWLERYFAVEDLFHNEYPRQFRYQDIDRKIRDLEDVEVLSKKLREVWGLGLNPIDSMVQLLEDKGIKIGFFEASDGFDACTFWVNNNVPVIATKDNVPGDRQRMNLAHELGHLMMELIDIDGERAAKRFAGAFLAPAEAVVYELGHQRHKLDILELYQLKHKYGLSMMGWIHRAVQLRIINETEYTRLIRMFRQKGWDKEEPYKQYPPKKTKRMERLILRALAEGVISRNRARELYEGNLMDLIEENKVINEQNDMRTSI